MVCVAATSADGKTFLTKRVAASRSWCPPSLHQATRRAVVRARVRVRPLCATCAAKAGLCTEQQGGLWLGLWLGSGLAVSARKPNYLLSRRTPSLKLPLRVTCARREGSACARAPSGGCGCLGSGWPGTNPPSRLVEPVVLGSGVLTRAAATRAAANRLAC